MIKYILFVFPFILSKNYGVVYQVIPETICQFIGIIDKNGKKIFEFDIVIKRVLSGHGYDKTGIVKYINGSFVILEDKDDKYPSFFNRKEYYNDGHESGYVICEFEKLIDIKYDSELLK